MAQLFTIRVSPVPHDHPTLVHKSGDTMTGALEVQFVQAGISLVDTTVGKKDASILVAADELRFSEKDVAPRVTFKLADGEMIQGIVPTARLKEYKIGSYVGNGVATGRQIVTGFQCKWVMIRRADGTGGFDAYDTGGSFCHLYSGTYFHERYTQVHLHATDGFVVGDGYVTGNMNGQTYYYLALGE